MIALETVGLLLHDASDPQGGRLDVEVSNRPDPLEGRNLVPLRVWKGLSFVLLNRHTNRLQDSFVEPVIMILVHLIIWFNKRL